MKNQRLTKRLTINVFVYNLFFFPSRTKAKPARGHPVQKHASIIYGLICGSTQLWALLGLSHESPAVGERDHLEGVHESIHALRQAALLGSGQRCARPVDAFPKAVHRYLAQHLLCVGQRDLLPHTPKCFGTVLGLILLHASTSSPSLSPVRPLSVSLPAFLRSRGSYLKRISLYFFSAAKNLCIILCEYFSLE